MHRSAGALSPAVPLQSVLARFAVHYWLDVKSMAQENPLVPRNPPTPVRVRRGGDITEGDGSERARPYVVIIPDGSSSPAQPYAGQLNAPPAMPAVGPSATPSVWPPGQPPNQPFGPQSPQAFASPPHVHASYQQTTYNNTTTVHHHHYAQPPAQLDRSPQRELPYRRRARAKGNSALGMASLAMGILACVIGWMPVIGLAAVPIGVIGIGLGVLGIIISSVFRRSRAGLPAGGIVVCVVGIGVALAASRSTASNSAPWREHVEKLLPSSLQSSAIFSPSASLRPSPHLPAATAHPRSSISQAAAPAPDPAVASAAADLRRAEDACAERIKQSADYRAALAASADAHAQVASLRVQSPHSGALMDASQQMIDADNALTDLIHRAQLADPAVELARQKLAAARGAAAGRSLVPPHDDPSPPQPLY